MEFYRELHLPNGYYNLFKENEDNRSVTYIFVICKYY